MRTISPFVLVLFTSVLLVAIPGGDSEASDAGQGDADYTREIDSWHAQRIERLTSETGWLTLVGLHPLKEGENTLGSHHSMDIQLNETVASLAGAITIDDGLIKLTFEEGVDAHVYDVENKQPIGYIELVSDAAGQPTVIELGSLLFYAIERGDQLYLRVKDRASQVLKSFTGIERFPVDPKWRVVARLEVPEAPQPVTITNALGVVEMETSPGTLVFELEGQTCRLTPMGEPGESMFIVLSDKTSGHTTYGGGRFLTADAPGEDGNVILDFNRAYNPPCVFSPYATCPLPPEYNQMPIAVTAGEKNWGEPH